MLFVLSKEQRNFSLNLWHTKDYPIVNNLILLSPYEIHGQCYKEDEIIFDQFDTQKQLWGLGNDWWGPWLSCLELHMYEGLTCCWTLQLWLGQWRIRWIRVFRAWLHKEQLVSNPWMKLNILILVGRTFDELAIT